MLKKNDGGFEYTIFFQNFGSKESAFYMQLKKLCLKNICHKRSIVKKNSKLAKFD